MTRAKRDVNVELLRILGACMVIGTHIKPPTTVKGALVPARVWISCLVGDGVAIFWMILGFFCFGQTDAKKRLSQLLWRVVLPMAAFTAFMFYFHDFIVGTDTLLGSISHTPHEYRVVLEQALLHWHSETAATGHFWYLWVYILVTLTLPALKGARDALVSDGRRDGWLLGLTLGVLIYNDVTGNDFFGFTHHTFGALPGAFVWMLTGDILYRRRALYAGRKSLALAGFVCAAAVTLLRTWAQYRCLLADPENNLPLFWYTSFAYLHVLALTVGVFGLSSLWARRPLSGIIAHLGGMTFGVYVWHLVVAEKLRALGVRRWLSRQLCGTEPGTVAYTAIYVAVIFIISLALAELCALPRRLLGCAGRR